MPCRFGERTHSRIECARSNSWGVNAETKKCRYRARRRSFSFDIPSYRTHSHRVDGGLYFSFPKTLSGSASSNCLMDADHFGQHLSASVASLRGLIGIAPNC